MKGWIKIHRRLVNHWLWEDAKKLKWWLTILMEVNFEDSKTIVGNKLLTCKRGESLKSLRSWARLFNTTPRTVKEFFKLLEKDKMVTTRSIQFSTHLTVCNYESYQESVNTNDYNNEHINDYANDIANVPQLKKKKEEKKNPDEILIKKIEVLPQFFETFLQWLQYKRKRGESYKDEKSTMLAYRKLLRLSNKDSHQALKIVEESMANNWAGLFELKTASGFKKPLSKTRDGVKYRYNSDVDDYFDKGGNPID